MSAPPAVSIVVESSTSSSSGRQTMSVTFSASGQTATSSTPSSSGEPVMSANPSTSGLQMSPTPSTSGQSPKQPLLSSIEHDPNNPPPETPPNPPSQNAPTEETSDIVLPWHKRVRIQVPLWIDHIYIYRSNLAISLVLIALAIASYALGRYTDLRWELFGISAGLSAICFSIIWLTIPEGPEFWSKENGTPIYPSYFESRVLSEPKADSEDGSEVKSGSTFSSSGSEEEKETEKEIEKKIEQVLEYGTEEEKYELMMTIAESKVSAGKGTRASKRASNTSFSPEDLARDRRQEECKRAQIEYARKMAREAADIQRALLESAVSAREGALTTTSRPGDLEQDLRQDEYERARREHIRSRQERADLERAIEESRLMAEKSEQEDA